MKTLVFQSIFSDIDSIMAFVHAGREVFTCGREFTAVFDYDGSGCIFQVELLHLMLDWPSLNESLVCDSALKGALRVNFEEQLVFLQLVSHGDFKVKDHFVSAYVVMYDEENRPIGLKFYDFDKAHGPLSKLNMFGVFEFSIDPFIRSP